MWMERILKEIYIGFILAQYKIACMKDIAQTNSPNLVLNSTSTSDTEGNESSVGSYCTSVHATAKRILLNALSDELDLRTSQNQSDLHLGTVIGQRTTHTNGLPRKKKSITRATNMNTISNSDLLLTCWGYFQARINLWGHCSQRSRQGPGTFSFFLGFTFGVHHLCMDFHHRK